MSQGQGLQYGDIFQGKYSIEDEVGRGSFGAVYRAREPGRAEPVAVKVLLPWVEADQEMRKRFQREAKLAQHMANPHGIRIYEFGETDTGMLYIVMEFLEGRPLDLILQEDGPLPPDRVGHIARQTLTALADAHKVGIIHRDLKPSNVFLCNNREHPDYVKVFDFGIAKIVGSGDDGTLRETTKLTVRGGLVGTPVYMSPEQCRGEDPTAASDIYSLGIMMFEMLTGNIPFDHTNPVQIMIMHNQAPVPPLPPGVAETPVGKVVLKALAKETKDRYECCEEVLAELDGIEYVPPAHAVAAKSGGRKPQLMRDIGYRETVALSVPEELKRQGMPDAVIEQVTRQIAEPIPAAAPAGNKYLVPAIIAACVLMLVLIGLLAVFLVMMLNKDPAPTPTPAPAPAAQTTAWSGDFRRLPA